MTDISTTRRYTADECEAILDGLDKALEEREKRIKITTREQWSPHTAFARIISIFFSGQVSQRDDRVVDSPYLQVLERNCSSDLALQRTDYQNIIDDSANILSIARSRAGELEDELAEASTDAGEKAPADGTSHLGDAARAAIAEHDRAILARRKQAKLDSIGADIRHWGAVAGHAKATAATAEADLAYAVRMVKSHYAARAMAHIKWCAKRIHSPYLLPGCLQGEEIIEQEGATCSY